MIPKVGKDLGDLAHKINKLRDDFLKHRKVTQNQVDGTSMVEYLEAFQHTEGTIYEDDIITKAIEKGLQHRKQEHGYEENVLIIDDMDRIDPEHIFRILNIFSAHFDRVNSIISKNKFGFDKIIVVCDILNIREIFRAKYGIRTDFNGYINKFYSNRIFEFDNRNEMWKLAHKVMSEVLYTRRESGLLHEYRTSDLKRIVETNSYGFLADFLKLLISNGQLDLRCFLKYKNVSFHAVSTIKLQGRHIDAESLPIFIHLINLSRVKGDFYSLKNAIAECIYQPEFRGQLSTHVTNILYEISYVEHNSSNKEIRFECNGRPLYLIIQDRQRSLTDKKQTNVQISFEELMYFLNMAIDTLMTSEINFYS